MFVLQTNANLGRIQTTLDGGTNVSNDQKPARDRPIYHKLDETIRGHVACSFLALVLKKAFDDRLAAADKGAKAPWPAVLAELDPLTDTESSRTANASSCARRASLALSVLGVGLPPTLRQIADA